MNDISAPVAARIDPSHLESDANLRIQVGEPTRRFRLWVQVPAWGLGFASIALGFLMVVREYDSPAGWFAVSVAVALSVIGSFRAPFSLGETSVSTAPNPSKKKATPPSEA
jgi:hypothetical protein